jgi:hypothetical protein
MCSAYAATSANVFADLRAIGTATRGSAANRGNLGYVFA